MVSGAWLVMPCTALPHSYSPTANTLVRPSRSPLSIEGNPEHCHGRPDRSREKLAKKMLCARPEADHSQQASNADEEGFRSRRHEDCRVIKCRLRQIDFLARPHILLRALVPQCFPLRTAGAAPAHFPKHIRAGSLNTFLRTFSDPKRKRCFDFFKSTLDDTPRLVQPVSAQAVACHPAYLWNRHQGARVGCIVHVGQIRPRKTAAHHRR